MLVETRRFFALVIKTFNQKKYNSIVTWWNSAQVKGQKRIHISVKGKAVPLQARTGPEGSRRLRLPDFKTIGT
jgi:hypothetical protein